MTGSDPVSPTVDVLLLRPIGLATFVAGIGLFCVAGTITLITRPHEMGKPFDRLIVRPAKYVWADPIGHH